ncbi:hypothetical protein BDR26DRAFT_858180 [Obelidium mucronatum]|nr:hypothetical protein BDR26DRAFT_858180 [Obelidium mucronatum]
MPSLEAQQKKTTTLWSRWSPCTRAAFLVAAAVFALLLVSFTVWDWHSALSHSETSAWSRFIPTSWDPADSLSKRSDSPGSKQLTKRYRNILDLSNDETNHDPQDSSGVIADSDSATSESDPPFNTNPRPNPINAVKMKGGFLVSKFDSKFSFGPRIIKRGLAKGSS